LIRLPVALIPVLKTFGPCSATVCTPSVACADIVGRGKIVHVQLLLTCAVTPVLPMAAENDLAHLRMLREVMPRVDNADDALLRDPLVAAVHSTCQASYSRILARPVLC
jgi:hypothetical protein